MGRKAKNPVPGASMFPRGSIRLYVVGLESGDTKIGVSFNPRRRVNQIARSGLGPVAWVHLFGRTFERFSEARRAELLALQLAASVARRHGATEVFSGLSRDSAIGCVRQALSAAASGAVEAAAADQQVA